MARRRLRRLRVDGIALLALVFAASAGHGAEPAKAPPRAGAAAEGGPKTIAPEATAPAPQTKPAAPKPGSQSPGSTGHGPQPKREPIRVRPPKPLGPTPGVQTPGAGDAARTPHGLREPDCGARFGVDRVEMSPPLDPGETLYVIGCGFGSAPPAGEVRILGDFPGGHQTLDILGWRSHRIAARVPALEGVHDMPEAKLQVVRRDGGKSEWVDVGGFRAAREAITVNPFAVNVDCAASGANAGNVRSRCDLGRTNWLVGQSVGTRNFFSASTVGVEHRWKAPQRPADNCSSVRERLDAKANAQGTDKAFVYLAKGWTITGFKWWKDSTGEARVETPTGIQSGLPSATVEVDWEVTINYCTGPHDSAQRYRLEIYAEGPKGVPHY